MEGKGKEKILIKDSFSDQAASFADFSIKLQDSKVIVEYCGGFWTCTPIKAIIDLDKKTIKIYENGELKQELSLVPA